MLSLVSLCVSFQIQKKIAFNAAFVERVYVVLCSINHSQCSNQRTCKVSAGKLTYAEVMEFARGGSFIRGGTLMFRRGDSFKNSS